MSRHSYVGWFAHYDLPGILRWFTANIGVHHVHHLCSSIPYYRLPRVLRERLQCVRLALWDESRRRLVSFRDINHRRVYEVNQAVMLPSWLFALLLGFSLCSAVNLTLQLLP